MNIQYLVFAYFSLFIFGLVDNGRGPLYPLILKAFSVSPAIGSSIFALSSLSGFIVAFFSDRWLSRLGVIRSTWWTIVTLFISCFIMGLSGLYSTHFFIFAMGSALFGVSAGALGITLNVIVATVTEKNNRRQYMSGLHSMYGVASFLAPLVVSLVLGFTGHWGWVFISLMIVPLIFLFSFLGLKEKKVVLPKNFVAHKDAKVLGPMIALYVATEILVSSRLVLYVKTQWGAPLDHANMLLSIFFSMLLFGRVFFALVKVPYKTFNLLRLSLISSICLILFGLFLNPLFLALSGLSMSLFFPMSMDWLSDKYQEESSTLIPQIMKYVGGALVGMHWIFGFITTYFSIQMAVAMGAFMLTICLYLLQKNK